MARLAVASNLTIGIASTLILLWRRYGDSTACGEIPPDFKRRESHLLSLKSPVGLLGRAHGFHKFPSGRKKRKSLKSFIGNMSKLENFVKKILAGAASGNYLPLG